jgi:prepilin peptidase CpaA
MNLVVSSPTWLTAILLVVLALAALEDVVRLRISNLTCAAVFIGAIVAMILQGFPLHLWQNAVVFVAILAIGTAAFSAGWLGGGDIKLLAAVGLWLDFQSALALIVATLLAGGLLGMTYIGARLLLYGVKKSGRKYSKVPYGLAIVGGAFLVFGMQLSHRASNPFAHAPDDWRVRATSVR